VVQVECYIKEIARLLKRARALLKLKGSPRTRSRFFTGPPYGEFSRDFASWVEEENEAAHAAAHVAEKTARAMAPMAAVGQKVVEGA
jgi:hypothetical protein